VRQKTISLTTFRKDGTPGSSPVSIVVEGITPTFEASSGRSRCAGFDGTPASNLARQWHRANQRGQRNLAARVCWTGMNI